MLSNRNSGPNDDPLPEDNNPDGQPENNKFETLIPASDGQDPLRNDDDVMLELMQLNNEDPRERKKKMMSLQDQPLLNVHAMDSM